MSNGGNKFHEMHTAHRYRPVGCSSCGAEFMAYGQRKLCDACKVAASNTPEARQKLSAQRAVQIAIAAGKLVRKPCVLCAAFGTFNPKTHGHHEDYSKPLDVIWLCSMDHIHRHQQINALRSKSLPHFPMTAEQMVAERIQSAKDVRVQNPTWKLPLRPWDADYVPSDYECRPNTSTERGATR